MSSKQAMGIEDVQRMRAEIAELVQMVQRLTERIQSLEKSANAEHVPGGEA
jgi:hypothetical protein